MILTLGGTNYFGPSAKTVTTGRKLAQCVHPLLPVYFSGADLETNFTGGRLNHEEAQTLEARRIENPEMSEKITGKVAGDVTIAGGAEDSYGLLKKREAPVSFLSFFCLTQEAQMLTNTALPKEEKKEGESKKEDDSKEE